MTEQRFTPEQVAIRTHTVTTMNTESVRARDEYRISTEEYTAYTDHARIYDVSLGHPAIELHEFVMGLDNHLGSIEQKSHERLLEAPDRKERGKVYRNLERATEARVALRVVHPDLFKAAAKTVHSKSKDPGNQPPMIEPNLHFHGDT